MHNQISLFDEYYEKVKALDELFARSASYRNSAQYFNLLGFINRFPQLSPFNAFLIHMQNSGVEIVLNTAKWARYGRSIKPNARPMVILIPFGPVDFVYDIADTEGDPIPEYLITPFHTSGTIDHATLNRTIDNCFKNGITYKEYVMHTGSAGYATQKRDNFTIAVNRSYSDNEKYSTLIHELGHIFAGHVGNKKDSWWKDRTYLSPDMCEIEAESISYLVCKRSGLNTSSEAYLSGYVSQNEEIPAISLDMILTVAGYIEAMGEIGFKPKKKNVQATEKSNVK